MQDRDSWVEDEPASPYSEAWGGGRYGSRGGGSPPGRGAEPPLHAEDRHQSAPREPPRPADPVIQRRSEAAFVERLRTGVLTPPDLCHWR
jgi:hypothetical protein